jgi:hypothetical protein
MREELTSEMRFGARLESFTVAEHEFRISGAGGCQELSRAESKTGLK